MQLHQFSLEGKWQDMAGLISDGMLDEFAIIATYDELVSKVKQRCAAVFLTVLLDLPPKLRAHETRVRGIVQALRQ